MGNGEIKNKIVNGLFKGWAKNRSPLYFSQKTFNEMWKEQNKHWYLFFEKDNLFSPPACCNYGYQYGLLPKIFKNIKDKVYKTVDKAMGNELEKNRYSIRKVNQETVPAFRVRQTKLLTKVAVG